MAVDCTGRIVVGHDDSAASMEAIRWAAALASALGRPLLIVHAWSWPLFSYGVSPAGMADPGAAPRNRALHLLDQAVEAARATADGELEVAAELIPGAAREVLGDISATADLLVIGTRGLGGVLGTLLGSVGRGLLHDAGCPVAIIRSDQYLGGPMLAACDGSLAGGEAVDLAADLAALWHDELRLLHVAPAGDPADEEEAARGRSMLREAGERARARRPGIAVVEDLVAAPSVPGALLDAATGARLLVLGHRGVSHDRFGSTAHAAVVHATGNLVVVRPRHGGRAAA
ncbi:universal stress protein [Brachybacterium sp. DNPG3]